LPEVAIWTLHAVNSSGLRPSLFLRGPIAQGNRKNMASGGKAVRRGPTGRENAVGTQSQDSASLQAGLFSLLPSGKRAGASPFLQRKGAGFDSKGPPCNRPAPSRVAIPPAASHGPAATVDPRRLPSGNGEPSFSCETSFLLLSGRILLLYQARVPRLRRAAKPKKDNSARTR
jgi:hypothetical protein